MQKSKIKAGQFYAYTTGTRRYGQRDRIKVLELDFPFTRKVRRGYGEEPIEVAEPGIRAVRVGEDGEPLRTTHRDGSVHTSEPFRLSRPIGVLHTWDDELTERESRKDAAEQREREYQESVKVAEQLQADLLSFLGHPDSAVERDLIASAEIDLKWHTNRAEIKIGEVTPERLLRLLNLAYQAGRRSVYREGE